MNDRPSTRAAQTSSAVANGGAISPASSPAPLAEKFRGSDLTWLPIAIGVVALWVVFTLLNNKFVSSRNLVNLATASASIGLIALGIVFVLLVAQIDLSVGSMSGVAASLLAVGVTSYAWNVWVTVGVIIAFALVVGLLYGWIFVKFEVHTFVITLAGLLALLGLQLWLLRGMGSINIPFDNWIVRFMQQMFIPKGLSYVLVAAVALGYLASALARRRRRLNHGLPVRGMTMTLLQAGILFVAFEAAAWYLNQDRGISAPFAFFVATVLLCHYLLTRTRWGRSIYAVGGSVEGARRSGINVKFVFVSAIVVCVVLAAIGGLLDAGRLASATPSSGTADVNLNAIAAAVIGGTSLYGGRGGAYSALLGIIVIESIANGLTLINLSSAVRFMITGGVLMIAVIVDAITRKSRQARGRA